MDSRLVKWLDESNLVDVILGMASGKEKLISIGRDVVEGHEADSETMSKWEGILKDGMDLLKPDNKSKDFPWEKASNYKSPVIQDAVRDFGDKYSTQVLGKPKLVAGNIEGDITKDKEDVIGRVVDHMNYQLNTEIKGWRTEQKSLGYQLAAQGTLFKKTWYDPAAGHNVSETISYPDFSVDNECSSFENMERFTHKKYYSTNDIFERVESGVWAEFEIPQDKTKSAYVDKEKYMFLEQLCLIDLDDDGYEEPYLVTVHNLSKQVVRVLPRWNLKCIMVEYEGATTSYDEMKSRLNDIEQSPLQDNKQFIDFKFDKLKASDRAAKLISINPIDMITKYGFIDPADGTMLNLGFCHIMISGIKGINKTTNSLFNAGDLSNQQSGFLAKGFREKKKGPIAFKPGMWVQTDIDASELANSMFPLPVKEPSQTLFNLNEGLKAEVKEQGTKVNIEDMMSPNIPAASVLGMLQEGSIPMSALMDNMISSMSHEFKIMFDLNKEFTDPVTYKRINDGEGDFESDYSTEIVIKPTANAKFSSQQQRIQIAQVQMEMIPRVLEIGKNPVPIVRYFFDAIESDITEAIFSDEVPPEEQKQLDQMKQLQQQETAAQQKQAEMLELQTKLMTREQDLRERESELKNNIESEKLRMQKEKQSNDFSIELTKLEEQYKKRLDESVASHKDLQLKYDTLSQSTMDRANDRLVQQNK